MLDVIQTLKSKQYQEMERNWTFNFCEYFPLMGKLREVRNLILEIDELPMGVKKVYLIFITQYVFSKTFQDDLSGNPDLYSNISLDRLDSRLVNCLFPYQKEGVK